jgi:hypothetical protein
VLDILVQGRRNATAAKRFFKRLLAGLKYKPTCIVTDGLRSCGAAAKSVDCLGADQAGEVRLPSGSEIVTADPANKAHEIYGGCDGDLLKASLGVPEIAGSSEPEAADGLGDGGLDSGTEIVEADELRRLLSLSSCLQGDVSIARSESHEASCRVWPGAVDLMGTGATVFGRELHLDDRRVAVVDRRAPA